MEKIYAGEAFPTKIISSIFLAGPTPRSGDVVSWRVEALKILANKKYDGAVFIPEPRNGQWTESYTCQVEWEKEGLHRADCILFWVPRNKDLPGFTTNVEFGWWFASGKVVLGAPKDAEKIRYLQIKAKEVDIPQADTLEGTIDAALTMVGEGSARQDGECQVPLHIWHLGSFQGWYQAQKNTGNRLDGARIEWTFRVGQKKQLIFYWVLHVDIFIGKESRHKTNEVVLVRPDIATVVAYKKGKTILDTQIVLTREFRSPGATADGFVHELPGGSSFKKQPAVEIAQDELKDETGLVVEVSRLKPHGARQLMATLSAHKAHVFSLELTDEELAQLRRQSEAGVTHGVAEDTERTYIEIRTVREILGNQLVDWSNGGMILQVLGEVSDFRVRYKVSYPFP